MPSPSRVAPTQTIYRPMQTSQVPYPIQSPLQTSAFFGSPSGSLSHSGYGPFGYSADGGLKNYVVMCKDDVEIRAAPSYADDVRTGQFLHPGQVVPVDDR